MKLKHWAVFILLGAIWSASFLWIKIAIREIGPMSLVAFRMLFGSIAAGGIAILSRPRWPRDRRTLITFLFLGAASLAIPVFLISWGEKTIDSAVASILNATVPLFTMLIAHYWLHDDRMTAPKVVGLLVGFAGVIILLSEDISAEAHNSVIGQAAVILAAVFYAFSAVWARRATQGIDPLVRGASPVIAAAAWMWLLGPILEKPFKIPALPLTWIALLWLGILGTGLAFIMLYYLIHEVGPTRASLVTYLFPIGGVILGVVFLQEHLSWQLIVGSALIISGIAFVNMRFSRRRAEAPATG